MRICFSICPGAGNEMLLSEHFGESDCFVLFDTQREVFIPHACHPALCKGPCHCHLPALQHLDFDAVICRNIGARAFAALRRSRISIFLTKANRLSDALSEWRQQHLPLAQKAVCRPEYVGRASTSHRRRVHGTSA